LLSSAPTHTFLPVALSPVRQLFFFFMTPATSAIYTLSLHDALPISSRWSASRAPGAPWPSAGRNAGSALAQPRQGRNSWHRSGTDRKSTRLNSSHVKISYAVFCLKKKNNRKNKHEDQRATHAPCTRR